MQAYHCEPLLVVGVVGVVDHPLGLLYQVSRLVHDVTGRIDDSVLDVGVVRGGGDAPHSVGQGAQGVGGVAGGDTRVVFVALGGRGQQLRHGRANCLGRAAQLQRRRLTLKTTT